MQIENLLFSFLAGFGILIVFSAFLMPRSTGKRIITDESGRTRVGSFAEATVINSLLVDISNRIRPQGKNLEDRLVRSGMVYASPEEYHSRRMISALVVTTFVVLIGIVVGLDVFPVAMLATAGAIFGFTMPDRAISGGINKRRTLLLREMGFGLDRISLLLGSGANVADALANTSGIGLFGKTCGYISSAIKTGKPIQEVIAKVTEGLPETPQLTAFMELIRVGIIQGQELSGPFKSMAEMMRERLELDIIEAGQRAGIQVTVITSGFIVVATLIVAVGPAVQTLMGSGLF
jgi:Flp pilus assembly protein TadB